MTFGRFETIQLPVKKTLERILVSPELAAKIRPVEVRPGICAATIAGLSNNLVTHLVTVLLSLELRKQRTRLRAQGAVSAQKALQGSNMRELLGGTEVLRCH